MCRLGTRIPKENLKASALLLVREVCIISPHFQALLFSKSTAPVRKQFFLQIDLDGNGVLTKPEFFKATKQRPSTCGRMSGGREKGVPRSDEKWNGILDRLEYLDDVSCVSFARVENE